MAYNKPYLVLPIKNYQPTFLHTILNSSVRLIPSITDHTRQLLVNSKMYLLNKRSSKLKKTGLLIKCCICPDVTLLFSTAYSTGNILYWILLSHQTDDIIIISSSSSPDTGLNDKFIHPSPTQVLQLINTIRQRSEKHTRLITAI